MSDIKDREKTKIWQISPRDNSFYVFLIGQEALNKVIALNPTENIDLTFWEDDDGLGNYILQGALLVTDHLLIHPEPSDTHIYIEEIPNTPIKVIGWDVNNKKDDVIELVWEIP